MGFSSQDNRHSSLHNNVESVDGDARSRYRSNTNPSLSHNPCELGIVLYFSVHGQERSGYRSHTSHNYSYNHGGLNIVYPSFTQEGITRGVQGKNIQSSHQSCVLYPHQNHPCYYSYPSMPLQIHTNMPPHPYPSMPPHPIC